jgi:endonuclease-8
MPEGDTLHKLAGYLRPRLEGRTLDAGHARTDREVDLGGRAIKEVRAQGKHLLLALHDGHLLRSHLGMRGSWHHYRHDEAWRRPSREAAVVLVTGDDVYVCFNPKEVELLRDRGVRARLLATRLGPDLAGPDVDLEAALRRARDILEPETPIVDVLLDQRLASGIGNVYKSEVLFLERVHPLTRLEGLGAAGLRSLYDRASRLLKANLGGGPRVTRPGNEDHLWVYGRKARPCYVCATPIRFAQMGRDRRGTYWCECCQGQAASEAGSPHVQGGLDSPEDRIHHRR